MSEKQPSDAAVRARATDPTQSFLVQAPAGSGKTELLTDRILALLGTVKRPEEIVAITFTRKAAAEMHERVLEKLSKGLHETPPAQEHERRSWLLARQALARDQEYEWGLLQYPARLTIRTIDSFCASLVRTMPWLSSMGGLPGIAEDARPHYLAAATATLELAGSYPEVKILLDHLDLDVSATRDALADMLGQRDQWLPHVEQSDDRHTLEKNLQSAVETDLALLLAVMPSAWAQELAPLASFAASQLIHRDANHPVVALLDWTGEVLKPVAADINRWKGLATLLLTQSGGLRRTVDVRIGFPAEAEAKPFKARMVKWLADYQPSDSKREVPEWLARLAALVATPEPKFTQGQWAIIQAQIQCLKLAAGQLILQFMQAGEVDFIEVARRADMALGQVSNPSDLLLKLDASIQHLLIDEFQDTSLSQISLIEKLTAGWQPDDGRSLFLVGDPMQSIYRFRKADVSLFIRVRDHGLGDLPLECLQLTDNFRSQSKIVEWVNATFEPMFPATDDPGVGAIAYAPSVAFQSETVFDAVQCHSFLPHERQASQQRVVDLARQALAQFSAEKYKHPVAVLVRARSHLQDVTQLLQQAGVACRAVELVPLHQRPYVVDLVQLARALTHPGDRLAWMSVLRSPYCGLTLESLHSLFGQTRRAMPDLLREALKQNKSGDPCTAQRVLQTLEYERLRAVAPLLLEALSEDDVEPFASRLERLWRALDGPAMAETQADLQDADSLFELIERLAPYGALEIDLLQERLKKLYASPDPHVKAVEIMTMHKCKGLQFETVILYGLQRGPASDRSPLLRFEQVESRLMLGPIKSKTSTEDDPIATYLARREKRRGEYEIDRLLYVAATRAKECLHLIADLSLLSGEPTVAEPVKGSLLKRLWSRWDRSTIAEVSIRPEEDSKTAPFYRGGWLTRRPESVFKARVSPALISDGIFPPREAVSATSPTFNAAYVWPTVKTHERVLGTLVHAWLDHIGRQGVARWSEGKLLEQRERIKRQCVQAGVPAPELRSAAQEVLETLIAMLKNERGQQLLSDSRARREWALLESTGKVSVLDLALQDEQGWLVVDYKTGRVPAGESQEAFGQRMLARYAKQLQRYCEQVSAIDGRAARAALYFPRDDLWFEFEPQV